MTLILDLVFRICIDSGAYVLYYLRKESQIQFLTDLGMAECHIPFLGHCDLNFSSTFRITLSC